MTRSTLSTSLSVVLGLGLTATVLCGGAGCQSQPGSAVTRVDDGSPDLGALKAGMSMAQARALCSQPPYRLVPVDENLATDGQPVPGACYLADVCPDCGGIRDVLCTLYFDKNDRLLRWHEGRVENDPLKVTVDGETLSPGMSIAEAEARFQAHRLVAVDEEHSPDGKAVPGAYYVTDICPNCGCCQEIFGTLHFDKAGKLASWQQGDAAESP